MKELDFLPQAYRDALWRRAQTRRNILLSIGLLLAMASLHGLNLTRIQSAQAALSAFRNGSGGWSSAQARLSDLEKQKAADRQRLELISRLEDAAPLDAAIGEVARLLTETMALRGLYVDTGNPPTAPLPPGVPQTNVTQPAGTRLRVTGVAANDVEVGVFLGKLSVCPLFADVTLCFSRDARSEGRRMREFEVKCTVRPVENAS